RRIRDVAARRRALRDLYAASPGAPIYALPLSPRSNPDGRSCVDEVSHSHYAQILEAARVTSSLDIAGAHHVVRRVRPAPRPGRRHPPRPGARQRQEAGGERHRHRDVARQSDLAYGEDEQGWPLL